MSPADRLGATVVDCVGKSCPVPVIDLANAVAGVPVGDEVVVVADDPGAKVDIPVWCRLKRHDLIAVDETGRGWAFRVRKTG